MCFFESGSKSGLKMVANTDSANGKPLNLWALLIFERKNKVKTCISWSEMAECVYT